MFVKVDTEDDLVDVALTEVFFAIEYGGLEPSFPTIAQILREQVLYPIIFRVGGGQVPNHPLEGVVAIALDELVKGVFIRES